MRAGCASGWHWPAGSAWLFDNSRPHGALNEGPPRIHLMVDLPDSAAVRSWIATAEPVEGEELAWFEGDRIRRLEDRCAPEVMAAVGAFFAEHGAKLKPASTRWS